MNEQVAIYAAARIQALEYLVGHLYALNYVSNGYTLEQVKRVNDAMISKVSTHTLGNTSAAMSDHYVAEMTAGVKETLDRVLATLVEAVAQSSGKQG